VACSRGTARGERRKEKRRGQLCICLLHTLVVVLAFIRRGAEKRRKGRKGTPRSPAFIWSEKEHSAGTGRGGKKKRGRRPEESPGVRTSSAISRSPKRGEEEKKKWGGKGVIHCAFSTSSATLSAARLVEKPREKEKEKEKKRREGKRGEGGGRPLSERPFFSSRSHS